MTDPAAARSPDPIFDEGGAACESGVPRGANPYGTVQTTEAVTWDRGWLGRHDAMMRDLKAQPAAVRSRPAPRDEILLTRARVEKAIRAAIDRMAKYHGDRMLHIGDFLDDGLQYALDDAVGADAVLGAEEALLAEVKQLRDELAALAAARLALHSELNQAVYECDKAKADRNRADVERDEAKLAIHHAASEALESTKRADAAEAARLAVQLENEELKAEIEATWRGLYNGYELEPRDVIEHESQTNGFKYPLVQAIHTIWKREPKVQAAEAAGTQLRQACQMALNVLTAMSTFEQPEVCYDEFAYMRLSDNFRSTAGKAARDLADRLARLAPQRIEQKEEDDKK